MEHPIEALEGQFIKRYKRFFADVSLAGESIVAHVPNTGSMQGLKEEGAKCLVTKNDDPKRKLKFTLQAVEVGNTWVGINTHLPNKIVWEAWLEGRIPHWKKYNQGQAEIKINQATRLDFVFWQGNPAQGKNGRVQREALVPAETHFVEVKNVTLAEGSLAQFPDAVTTRGQKHLEELMELMEQGFSAELLFTVQRNDCREFSVANKIDIKYGALLKEAVKMGLKVSPYICSVSSAGVRLEDKQKLKFIG